MGHYLEKRLNNLRELGVVGEVRGKGLMIGVEFVRDPNTLQPFPAEVEFGLRVGKNCVHKKKMLIRSSPNWIALAPPFIVTEEEIDDIVQRLQQAIIEELNGLKG
jgi:adenosylmethionine-8-amino-7-oxononanoate aminotransferase